ncbi:hypothetical protein [Halocatena marina]|uniref:hypothetical protein n=1 Tax=Halocatena marina TaxID=2934937 RepID=UPI00200CD5AC|nr:hypothetical protein [Halocatena marina]
MQPVTIRFDEDEIEDLDDEAENRGFANRTEYIRWIVHNRNGISENAADELQDHEQRLTQIEQFIEELRDE